jgi:predicted pyridoxine 5'-phosphate oxidase superfamily flavin-nucleotide-binding protein
MCHYPGMVAALTRDSAERPATSPADHRPDIDDITLPPAEKHLVSTVSRAEDPRTTILEGNLP